MHSFEDPGKEKWDDEHPTIKGQDRARHPESSVNSISEKHPGAQLLQLPQLPQLWVMN